jgi:ergothioneine biosynthesis protein EgtB
MTPQKTAFRADPSLSPLAQRFQLIRKQTEALIRPLSAEDCQLQSMPDASPAKWHLAHLTWFFETFVLEKFEPGFKPFNASFRVLFNSYYNGVGDKYPRPQRGLISRPSLDEVLAYRAQVDDRVLKVMAATKKTQRRELEQLIALGLQHEQQHQELLLTDIKHALSFNPQHPAYARRWPLAGIHPQPVRWHGYGGGQVSHGFDAAQDGEFAFDNETPRHAVYVAPFELASRLVTNGEMLAFIADGGYQRPELWLSMGWDWVMREQTGQPGQPPLPLYWQGQAGAYQNFTLHGLVDLDPNTPACHLSYFEADAFARWSGARLPTELNGNWRPAPCRPLERSQATLSRMPPSTRCRSRKPTMACRRKCWATCGNGPSPTTTPTPATNRGKGWSASTTASSCATSSCCAAAPAPHRAATCGRATATFFRPMRNGNSAACGWRAIFRQACAY